MERIAFDDGWSVRAKANPYAELVGETDAWTPVHLPHDAMIATTRSADQPPANAYFPGGTWEYTKTWAVPAAYAGQRLFLHFEGVYRDARVLVDGVPAGHRPYGYSGFTVRIDHLVHPGAEATVLVEATAGDDTRWYSGAGIHRPVHLLVGPPVRIEEVDGLRVRTVEVEDGDAVVEVDVLVVNDGSDVAPRRVVTTLLGPDGSVVAEETSRLTCVPGRTEHVRRRFHLPAAALWSPASPALHRCTVTLLEDDAERDRASTTFGVRTVRVDADRGLRINGETVKLRGACVHHDNGVLGSATIDRAEERRVELLRQAGFNAIRSAHNPMSEAMLGACDRLGMLVMDEAFDTWTEPKSTYDYARAFHDWWAADLAAMVAKDRNHPCVVLYSIGNEISDIGRPDGARRVRELADHLRTLDPDRFVTLGVNPILACGAEVFAQADAPPMPAGINSIMTLMQDYVPQVLRSQLVDERLDVLGRHIGDGLGLVIEENLPA